VSGTTNKEVVSVEVEQQKNIERRLPCQSQPSVEPQQKRFLPSSTTSRRSPDASARNPASTRTAAKTHPPHLPQHTTLSTMGIPRGLGLASARRRKSIVHMALRPPTLSLRCGPTRRPSQPHSIHTWTASQHAAWYSSVIALWPPSSQRRLSSFQLSPHLPRPFSPPRSGSPRARPSSGSSGTATANHPQPAPTPHPASPPDPSPSTHAEGPLDLL
jgi:hypothetical protein